MSSWDILGGDGGDSNDEEEVEYVGVIEDDAPPVREPMRPERRSVRRVTPRHMPMDQEIYSVPQSHKANAVGAPNRDEEDLVSYVDMPHGKQLGLTPEAIDRLQNTPMTEMNGQMSQRLEPGTYVMYGPSRADGMGALGTNGKFSGGGGQQVVQRFQPVQDQQQQSGGLFGGIADAVSGLAVGITEAAVRSAASRREEEAARYAAELQRDAASEAAQIGLQTAMLEQQVRLAEIESGSDQLEELRAALAARSAAPPVVGGSSGGGTSPAVWILVAVLGLGAVGGVVWVATKKEPKKKRRRKKRR